MPATSATQQTPTDAQDDIAIPGGIDFVDPAECTTMSEPTQSTEIIEPPLMGVPVDPDLWD